MHAIAMVIALATRFAVAHPDKWEISSYHEKQKFAQRNSMKILSTSLDRVENISQPEKLVRHINFA